MKTGNGDLKSIAYYIWGIGDDVPPKFYVRGKYRHINLPIAVLRRLDAVLEHTKQAVLDVKTTVDPAGVVARDLKLRQTVGQP